jgi:hypothetical protein
MIRNVLCAQLVAVAATEARSTTAKRKHCAKAGAEKSQLWV